MGRLTGLDALRGIAALCVLIHHLRLFEGFPQFTKGYLAVDFFFVLSGYVMARTYEGDFPGAATFLWMRFKRFWPTVQVGSALGLLILAWRGQLDVAGVLLALAIVPNPWTMWAFPFNPPAWSLFLELTANYVHGFIARVPTWLLTVAVVAFAVVNMPFAYVHGGNIGGPEFHSLLPGLARVGFGYILGIVLFRWWHDRPPVRPYWRVTALLLPLLLGLGQFWWFDFFFVAVACPVLVAGGLAWDATWGRTVGSISFPLYAVHYPIVEGAVRAGLPWWVASAAALGLAAVMSDRWRPRKKRVPA
jgi:peptidoglycan/LPS O-acetylase OafA/YrhL